MPPTIIEITDGGKIFKDPADKTRIRFVWDSHFDSAAQLIDEGEFTITSVRPVEGSPVSLSISGVDVPVLASGNRDVDFTLIDGTPNVLYRVAHKVTTNEIPAQIRERSFDVHVKEL